MECSFIKGAKFQKKIELRFNLGYKQAGDLTIIVDNFWNTYLLKLHYLILKVS